MTALPFNPFDWYWKADDGRIFSSKLRRIVSDDDAGYVAWTAGGTLATIWPRDESGKQTDAALNEVLAPYGLSTDLTAYVAAKRYEVETAGISVGGSPIATDRESQALINGAYNLAQAKPDTIFKFKSGDGFVDLDAAAIQIIAVAVGEHVQACFSKEAEVLGELASGIITTTAQIDAAFASLG